MPLTAGTRLGAYEIVTLLGAGGMGEVYRAKDTRLDRTVAIKILPQQFSADPDARARFEREGRAISALEHPHICALYDIGEAPNPQSLIPNPDKIQFLVMQYLDGETLDARLTTGRFGSRKPRKLPSRLPARSTKHTARASSTAI